MAEEEFKWVGDHAQDLADGRMLAPGETAMLSDEALREPHNESLIADGGLIPVDDKGKHEAQLASRRARTREQRQEQPTQVGDTAAEGEEG